MPRVSVAPYLIGLTLVIYISGIFLHYVGDAQKYYTLKNHASLIDDGLFAHTRNPNYLGEIMMYFALALMAQHWLPFVIWSGWAFGFFVKNMSDKDASMAKFRAFGRIARGRISCCRAFFDWTQIAGAAPNYLEAAC